MGEAVAAGKGPDFERHPGWSLQFSERKMVCRSYFLQMAVWGDSKVPSPSTRMTQSRYRVSTLPLSREVHLAFPCLPRAMPRKKAFCERLFHSKMKKRTAFPSLTSATAFISLKRKLVWAPGWLSR